MVPFPMASNVNPTAPPDKIFLFFSNAIPRAYSPGPEQGIDFTQDDPTFGGRAWFPVCGCSLVRRQNAV